MSKNKFVVNDLENLSKYESTHVFENREIWNLGLGFD